MQNNMQNSDHSAKPPGDKHTALLVIDVQVGLITGAHAEHEVLAAINRCIQGVRQLQSKVFFIQHCHSSYEPLMRGAQGWQLHPQLDQTTNDAVLEKTASDAFYNTDLHAQLQSAGIQKVIVCGLQTEYCVDTTCRAAISLGYQTSLLSDGHTTGEAQLSAAQIIEHHNLVLSQLAHPNGSATLVTSSAW